MPVFSGDAGPRFRIDLRFMGLLFSSGTSGTKDNDELFKRDRVIRTDLPFLWWYIAAQRTHRLRLVNSKVLIAANARLNWIDMVS